MSRAGLERELFADFEEDPFAIASLAERHAGEPPATELGREDRAFFARR